MNPEELEAKKKADAAAKEAEDKAAADKAKKDAEEAEAKKKADAEAGTTLDKKLSGIADSLGAIGKRMDAFEEKFGAKKDADDKDEGEAERIAADKAKKDAEEAEAKKKADAEAEEKKKADAAKADSVDIRRRIEEVASLIPKSVGDVDYHAVVGAQARADDVYSKFGGHAPRPLPGETVGLYERRAVRDLKQHSPTWKAIDVTAAFADDASFTIVRDQVYAEATKTALSPATVKAGEMRMITRRQGGHEINTFVGEPDAWMGPMAGATRQYVTSIKTPQ